MGVRVTLGCGHETIWRDESVPPFIGVYAWCEECQADTEVVDAPRIDVKDAYFDVDNVEVRVAVFYDPHDGTYGYEVCLGPSRMGFGDPDEAMDAAIAKYGLE